MDKGVGIGEVIALAKTFGGGGGSSGGGVLVVNITWEGQTATCDKTAGEMYDAYKNGGLILCDEGEDWGSIRTVVGAEYEDSYNFYVFLYAPSNSMTNFTAESANDYPSYTDNGSGE